MRGKGSALVSVADGRSAETGDREYLGFVLAAERYALPLSCIREISRVPAVTEVPRAPAGVLGVISMRGEATTLVDLREALRVSASPLDARSRVLLVDRGAERFGLLVDRVLQVYRLRPEQVELASVLGNLSTSYVTGIGRPGQAKALGVARGASASEEILVLLDEAALLKRYEHD